MKSVAGAANAGGATLVDIACSPELVEIARNAGDVPVCVSAVDPAKFVAAVRAGADMVEIGNYDAFYAEGRIFSAEEVLALTVETRERFGASLPLSVTVPHTLPLDEQVLYRILRATRPNAARRVIYMDRFARTLRGNGVCIFSVTELPL